MSETVKSEYRGGIHQRQKELMMRWYGRLAESATTGRPPAVSLIDRKSVV